MGTRQTKGSLAERASPGAAPGPRRERPDFWASLLLRAGDKAGRAGAGAGLPPYHRRVGMVQELLRMVRQGRREEAGTLLQHLRQDLGMESTSLDDVLYRYASFRNLVDPITHDLIISLARYIHCPKPPQGSPGREPPGQHRGPVGHPAEPPRPGARGRLPAALRGAGGQRGAGLHGPHGRHGPAAAAGSRRAAPADHAGPQRQPADAGPAARPHRRPEGPRSVPQRHVDRPGQQRGHLRAAPALPARPAQALPQAGPPAHHPGAGRGPGQWGRGPGRGCGPGGPWRGPGGQGDYRRTSDVTGRWGPPQGVPRG
ncbi:leucine-rich repeat-containing protein 75A isoform X2 [Kogia breviceps]|uniref:leucine-rich repeat-containing protein 75A isoform X2 n=1 Tax=Kogia breviceps TaxID=27615 RepID=UPI0027956562|nr:leucine-rich repeat-containing protein 75A isoform X2 [Kogia breviceps]